MAQKKLQKKEAATDYSEFEEIAASDDYSDFEKLNTSDEYSDFEELGSSSEGFVIPAAKGLLDIGKGLGSATLSGLEWAGDRYEEGVTAPFRTLVGELQQGNIKEAIPRTIRQIGGDPKTAPSGYKIMQGFGSETRDEPFVPKGSVAEELIEKTGLKAPTTAQVEGGLAEFLLDPGLIGKPLKATANALGLAGKYGAKALGAAGDALLGEKVVSGPMNIAGKTVGAIKQSGFKPNIIEGYDELLSTAKKFDIPENELAAAVKFGPDSLIAQTEKTVMQGPAGKDLQAAHAKTHNKIKNAFYDEIKTIGPNARKDDAGDLIRTTVKKAQDSLFKDLGSVTMKQASKEAPLSAYTQFKTKDRTPFEVIRDWITNKPKESPKAPVFELSKEGSARLNTTLEQARQKATQALSDKMSTIDLTEAAELTKVVDSIQNIKSYDDAVRKLQKLGKVTFEDPAKAVRLGQVTAPKKEMVDIYFTLQDAILDTIKTKIDPTLAQKITENNQLMTTFFKDRNLVMPLIESGSIPPEKVFSQLVGKGDSQKIQALKRIIPEEDFKTLAATYVNSLISKSAVPGSDLKGTVNYVSTLANIEDKREFLSLILPEQKIKDLENVLKLGALQGGNKLNTSGTQISDLLSRGGAGLLTAGGNRVGYEILKESANKGKQKIPLVGRNGYIGQQTPSRFEMSAKSAGLIGRQPKKEEKEE